MFHQRFRHERTGDALLALAVDVHLVSLDNHTATARKLVQVRCLPRQQHAVVTDDASDAEARGRVRRVDWLRSGRQRKRS